MRILQFGLLYLKTLKSMKILNLTQHDATPNQIEDGVIEPEHNEKESIKRLLTFNVKPEKDDIEARAWLLSDIALRSKCKAVMIGGAPFLMPELSKCLKERGIRVLFSFSLRKSIEKPNEKDGSVEKVSVFEHIGFVEI